MGAKFTFLIATLLLLVSVEPVSAQRSEGNIPHVGFLVVVERAKLNDAFRQELKNLGYIEGQNLILDYRSAGGNTKRLLALAQEMVSRKPDVIVTHSTPGVRAVKKATTTIPIVMATVGNAVKRGFVKSMALPGGNITGNSFFGAEMAVKRVGVLKNVLPSMSRMALLAHPSYPKGARLRAEAAVKSLGMDLQLYFADGPQAIDEAFSAMNRQRAEGVQVLASSILYANRAVLIDAAARYGIPVVYPWRAAPEKGGLMSYGPDLPALFKRAAIFVDKILKGAKPQTLPVERPTKFEMVINLKTANKLGIAIPRSVLLLADRIIE
jgi:putative ABC transport system substrate-binding protein